MRTSDVHAVSGKVKPTIGRSVGDHNIDIACGIAPAVGCTRSGVDRMCCNICSVRQ